ncbi:phosphatase PAP2 family protein, partial [Bradyrhizobium yuanmingense]|uniref:phosphatase PAP2 family protein n=2 Tax=Bradyrhizobium TaxID=374 RepID=UPI001CD27013
AGGAGGAILGTLGDVWANPIMVDALIRAREGTIVVPERPTSPYFYYYAPALPGIEDPAQLDRWEPWVRAYTAVGEMLQGITLQVSGADPNAFLVRSSAYVIAEIGRPVQSTFQDQIEMVVSWAELRNERATEIMAQIDPQYAFWSSIVYLHPERTRRTFELINMVLQFCVYVEMRFKHALGCSRPVEYNAQVQPMITTPGHGSFPSGHATQAYAVAYVLKRLLSLHKTTSGFPEIVEQLDRQAARIATNRVVAGVHFPVDSMAGRMLGIALGEYFVGRCLGSTATKSRKFNASHADSNSRTDFNPFHADQALNANKFYSETTGGTVTQSLLMKELWDKAYYEVSTRFP